MTQPPGKKRNLFNSLRDLTPAAVFFPSKEPTSVFQGTQAQNLSVLIDSSLSPTLSAPLSIHEPSEGIRI